VKLGDIPDPEIVPPAYTINLSTYPNPFRIFTNLKVDLAASGTGGQVPVNDAAIQIYNLKGQRVRSIALDPHKTGE